MLCIRRGILVRHVTHYEHNLSQVIFVQHISHQNIHNNVFEIATHFSVHSLRQCILASRNRRCKLYNSLHFPVLKKGLVCTKELNQTTSNRN